METLLKSNVLLSLFLSFCTYFLRKNIKWSKVVTEGQSRLLQATTGKKGKSLYDKYIYTKYSVIKYQEEEWQT